MTVKKMIHITSPFHHSIQIIVTPAGKASKEVRKLHGREGSVQVLTLDHNKSINQPKTLIINSLSLMEILLDPKIMTSVVTEYHGCFLVNRVEKLHGKISEEMEDQFEEEKEQSFLISQFFQLAYSTGYQNALTSMESDQNNIEDTKFSSSGRKAYKEKLHNYYNTVVKPVYDRAISENPKRSNYALAKYFMESGIATPNGSTNWEENSVKRFRKSLQTLNGLSETSKQDLKL